MIDNNNDKISYYFGDSFIGIFKIVKNRSVRVMKFKAKTAKGISKDNDEDKKIIIDTVGMNVKNIKCLVFNFGSVDVHFSFFHLLIKHNFEIKYKDIYKAIAKNYVKFIKNINVSNEIKIIILPCYSPIKDKYVVPSLIAYSIISEEDAINHPKINNFTSIKCRNKIVKYFNKKVKHYASKYNIACIDINKKISTNGIVDDKYRDISKYNIHLVWETTIVEYIDSLNNCGINEKLIDFSQYDKYLLDKKRQLAQLHEKNKM